MGTTQVNPSPDPKRSSEFGKLIHAMSCHAIRQLKLDKMHV